MKKVLLTAALAAMSASVFAMNISTPVGLWKQMSDKTGKLHSIIKIYEGKDGKLYGKVMKGYGENGHPPPKYCSKCEGSLHNKPMVGLVIMRHFEPVIGSKIEWSEGKILDPDSGSTYHCNMTLENQGEKLDVRGYIGIPLFGRSQEWYRCKRGDKKCMN